MTEQLDTSAAAVTALLERVDEWWDYDHGNIFKDVANLLPALSAQLTALRAERDAALARVGVLEAALTGARGDILSLIHGRDCEAEGSDEDWVGDIDAALAKGETL